jgi:glycoprotein-N-acetylgalactosamine 3-beta-galactosyltransferase
MIQTRSSKTFFTTVIFISILYLSINPLSTYFRSIKYDQNDLNRQVRIYCLIITSPKYFDTRARAVNLTWASRCDQFTFISEYSNDTKGLSIAPIANITPGYEHLTQKTTLALHYVYENFINDADWFVKADDDTYLFVENLKTFLKDKNTSEPITFGYNFKVCTLSSSH